jgi:phosphoribosylanthranilate isomerase
MTAIKICGLTREEDVALAAQLGADFVGFVLWPQSPRAATLDVIGRAIRALPPSVTPVGVFVNPTAAEIEAAAAAGIALAQIHGEPPLQLPPSVGVVRAVHLRGDGDAIEPDVPDGTVLLDAHDPVKHGGTGTTIDWDRAARIARTRRIFLAGGLTAANVAEAIARVQPYAVDVASGVESRPGIKDHAQLRAFITAVKEKM